MREYRLRLAISLIILLGCGYSLSSCGATRPAYYPDGEWRASTPEEQGVDSNKIVAMLQSIQASKLDFHSILIIKNGYLITETYWAPYHRTTTHNVKSAAKSIISALVGIALEHRCLNVLRQKVSEFFPEYVYGPLKENISLSDLMTMRSGLNWKEDSGPSPFDVKRWKDVSMRDRPGERFEYNTALTHMMSAILTKVSKEDTRNFADSFLFKPLGIKNYEWKRGIDGYYCGGSELFLTPRDMAKFGYLYLNNGLWDGQQVVPSQWIRDSTSNKVRIASDANFYTGLDYGYWWWIQEKAYMAWGAGGQYIVVRPDLDLVVVITANGFDKINRYEEFFKSFLAENIYSAVKSNYPLPANPAGVQELNRIVQEVENPKEMPKGLMPEIAAKISHKIYSLESNAEGFESISFAFDNNDASTWEYVLGGKTVHARVGLRGNYLLNRTDFSMGVHPESETIACKGHWKDDKTFVIEHHIIGDPSKQVIEIYFNGQDATMHISTMGMDATIKGRWRDEERL